MKRRNVFLFIWYAGLPLKPLSMKYFSIYYHSVCYLFALIVGKLHRVVAPTEWVVARGLVRPKVNQPLSCCLQMANKCFPNCDNISVESNASHLRNEAHEEQDKLCTCAF